MKRANFLSNRCQKIANILHENRTYLGDAYCNAIFKRLELFSDKMDDEFSPTETQTLVKLLENVKARIPSNTVSPKAISARNPGQLNSSASAIVQEAGSNIDWMPQVKEIVMKAISGTVHGDAILTQIAYALGSLSFNNATSVSIEQANNVILQKGAISLTQEQLVFMTAQLAELKRIQSEKDYKMQVDKLEAEARQYLKQSYSTSEYANIKGIFGKSLQVKGEYINFQMLRVDLKNKKTEEDKESKHLAEAESGKKYKDAHMTSMEDLFENKHAIKAENLFKPVRELFDNKALETIQDTDEVPRLILMQGRAGVGKTTFVHYAAHQWSQGLLYNDYTWVFILTLRKLRLFPISKIPELNLQEWIRQSQFGAWDQKEFFELWQQRIEPAIHQNQVLLILDGYDETPEHHSCQSILQDLLTSGGRYPNLLLLVTTRPCDAQRITEKRRNLEIIGFTDENIHQYIQTYFLQASNKTLVHSLIEAFRKQPVIWANAHIPLNLNLLCGIMEDAIKKAHVAGLAQRLTQLCSMTRLYQVMERKLYDRAYARHDSEPLKLGRQLIRVQTDFIKHYQKERFFLAKLAFQSFETERLIIPIGEIGVALQAHVDKEITRDSQKSIQQEKENLGEVFFEEVCGLGLIKPVLDISGLFQVEQDYEFLHLTFQEYYTAIYLVEGLSSKDLVFKAEIEKVLLREKYNPRWQIVWWFVAGLLRENAPAYKSYLEQLQSKCNDQALVQDIFEHHQLGLLARCIDEGFEANNQKAIEPIVQQLQCSFLKHYQIAKNITGNDSNNIKNLRLIKSSFFSAYRISPNLCMHEKQDLYALIPPVNEHGDKRFLLAWIGSIQVVTPKSLSILAGLLTGKDSLARHFAAEVLRVLGAAATTPQMLDVLMELLESKDPWMCCSGIEVVGALGSTVTSKMLNVLLKLLAHQDWKVRRSATEALGKLGAVVEVPKLLDTLMGLLAYKSSDVRRSAAEVLGKLGVVAATPKLLGTLCELLADEDCSVRLSAAEAVGKLGAAATEQLLDPLLKLFVDKDDWVRRSAAEAVGKLVTAATTPRILDALITLLRDKNDLVRRNVVGVIGMLDPAAIATGTLDAVLDLLVELLKANDDVVRCNAAKTIGKLVIAAKPRAWNMLTELLRNEDSKIRAAAAQTVVNLGTAATPELLHALARLLAGKDEWWARRAVALAISNLGVVTAPKPLNTLLDLLVDKEKHVRSAAAQAVGSLGAGATSEHLAALFGLLMDKDSDVCCSALCAVGNLGSAVMSQTVDRLIELLVHKDWKVRCAAAKAVSKLDVAVATPQLLEVLFKLLMDEKDDVFSAAAVAVDKLVSAAPTLFLGWLLDICCLANNDKALSIFRMHIDFIFTLIPSFLAKNTDHPNLLAFVSYTLAAAYLSSCISCQIDFFSEEESADYYMAGFVGKLRYHFLITEVQAQRLLQLSSLVIEQLSKTGKLDITELGTYLLEWEKNGQNSLLSSQKFSVRGGENMIIHLPRDLESTSEQKGTPLLTQYQQGSQSTSETGGSQNYRKAESACNIT